MIATKHDIAVLLADEATYIAALAHLQCLMDERYQYDAAGTWGIVEPNGLTRLGLTAAEAVAMGAVDRVVGEPAYFGPTLEQAQAVRIIEAAAACDAVLAPLAARFSARETLTWPAQLSEARALLADPTLAVVPDPASEEAKTWVDPIPTLRGITAVTGEDLGAFAGAVVKNNDDWTRITTYAIGQRQRIVARIKECGTVEEVVAVDVAITLPG